MIGLVLLFLHSFFPFMPFVLLAGTNVAFYGIKCGFLLNYGVASFGAICAFLFARYFARERVEKWLHRFEFINQFNMKMSTSGFLYVIIAKLIPILPSSAISYAAGLTRIRLRDYMLATLIGNIPIIALESYIAHDMFHFAKHKGRLFLLLAIFIFLIYLGSLFKKKLMSASVPETKEP